MCLHISSTILFYFYFGGSSVHFLNLFSRKDIFFSRCFISNKTSFVLTHLHSHSSKAHTDNLLCLVIQTRHMHTSEFIFSPGFVDWASSHPSSFECLVALPPPKPPVGARLERVLVPGTAPCWYWLSDLSSDTLCHWDMKKQNSYSSHSVLGMRQHREWRELWWQKASHLGCCFSPTGFLGRLFPFSETCVFISIFCWDLFCVLISKIIGSKPVLRLWAHFEIKIMRLKFLWKSETITWIEVLLLLFPLSNIKW